jgi:prepilin peptidase CpaA
MDIAYFDGGDEQRGRYLMIEAAALIVFPVLMAFAASSDLLTMTISNRISIILVVSFLALGLALRLPWEVLAENLACGGAILAVTFALYCRGWIGGGDAKLAAATAVWLGWAHVLDYGLVTSVFGGILTFVILMVRRWPLPQWLARQQWLARLHEQGVGVPYGIALAAAGLFIYPDTQIWLQVIRA